MDVRVDAGGVQRAAEFVAERFLRGEYSIHSWLDQPLNPKRADENAIQW